jgi:hypothetical protein
MQTRRNSTSTNSLPITNERSCLGMALERWAKDREDTSCQPGAGNDAQVSGDDREDPSDNSYSTNLGRRKRKRPTTATNCDQHRAILQPSSKSHFVRILDQCSPLGAERIFVQQVESPSAKVIDTIVAFMKRNKIILGANGTPSFIVETDMGMGTKRNTLE